MPPRAKSRAKTGKTAKKKLPVDDMKAEKDIKAEKDNKAEKAPILAAEQSNEEGKPETEPKPTTRSLDPPATPSNRKQEVVTSPGETPAKPSRLEEDEVDKKPSEAPRAQKSLAADLGLSEEGKENMRMTKLRSGSTFVQPLVHEVYKVVRRLTGSLGGNGSGGAIYGELTIASMQKVVNLMKEKGGLTSDSIFIDVGAGLGKPNLHVAVDPQVQYSVGVEMEEVRWLLSAHNLRHLVAPTAKCTLPTNNVAFLCEDAWHAKSFNPFTHVYMFDIGFPPALFRHLAALLSKSDTAKYVLCYHNPKLMIDRYGFKMEFIDKQATSMHGSQEGHTAYLYKCTHPKALKDTKPPTAENIVRRSDPAFREAFSLLTQPQSALVEWLEEKNSPKSGPGTRASTRRTRSSLTAPP